MAELTRVEKLRINAAKGGRATAEKHGKDFCIDRATKGGLATLTKYGIGYYSTQLAGKKA